MNPPAVLFGGPSPEHDISILTGLQAARALAVAGPKPEAIYWTKTGEFFRVRADLEAVDFANGVPSRSEELQLVAKPGAGFIAARRGRSANVGTIVNACHGGPGEDGTLQAALDLAGVRYTGPSAAGAALGMDKLAFAGVITGAGLPSLPRHALTLDGAGPGFPGPYIVKPRYGGSSIGIEITDELEVARALLRGSPHYLDGAIVEPYLPDAIDLNVSVRTWPRLTLSPIERPIRRDDSGRIYTYAEKYLGGGEGLSSAPRELPAVLEPAISGAIEAAARSIASLARVRGVARLDFLLTGSQLYVNELNTIPGALSWYLWTAGGLPFSALLADLIAEAEAAGRRRWPSEGADGSALRAAGSIAGKLA